MWQALAPSVSSSLDDIRQQQAGVITAISGQITAANTALANADSKTTFSVNSQASAAGSLNALRDQIGQLINTAGNCLVVHPWQQDVGTGDGIYRWLSPQTANTRMVEKLRGVLDERQPKDVSEAIAIMVFATGIAEFSEQLQLLNAVFPVPELQMIQRRCSASINHESSKMQQVNAPLNPHWENQQYNDLQTVKQLDSGIGTLMAQVESCSADINPITELQALATKKTNQVSQYQQAWADLAAGITGGAGVGAFIQGSVTTIADLLEQNSPAGYEYPLAAGVLWLGNDLTLLKEVLLP